MTAIWRRVPMLCVMLVATGIAPYGAEWARTDLDPEIEEFILLANQHRRSVGCRELIWHPELGALAQRYSEDMATRNFYGHRDPEGNTVVERLRMARIPWTAAAENIARTQYGGEQAFLLWLGSAPHRRSLENCRLTHHGLGLSNERWTHLFVRAP